MSVPTSSSSVLHELSPHELNVSKEGTYFALVLVLSLLVWLALALSIIGLFYALLFGVMFWIGNGLLTAHLRSEAVLVTREQLPELNASFEEVCSRLGVDQVPALYVIQSGGLLNAFATRFAGRDFVVVYSDMLEALGPNSPEMRFVLGHEIGHLKSRHIFKQIVLAPGLLFPLVGPAYRRAWETSCDRYGAFAAQDADAAVRAMLVLSGGREHGPRLNARAFSTQHHEHRGFFVSLHELTSTYPTLSRRVTDLLALKDGVTPTGPRRNPLAYLFAFFMPGGNFAGGGAAGMMMMVVVIGLLAAMAIPAFQKVRQNAQAKVCMSNQRMLGAALNQFHLETGRLAESWDEVVGPGKYLVAMPVCPLQGDYSADFDEASGYTVSCSLPHEELGGPERMR